MAEGMNFSFGRRQEKIDWRRLASVDVDRILREMDVKTLQDNIMHVTFSNIEAELGMQAIGFDPNYIKLFRLAQLIIEYLLHSQQFLSANLEAENKTLQESLETTERVKKELDEKKEAYKKLKKECQKQKQWIAEYQLLIRAGASGSHKCPYCAKSFVSHEYVIAHLSRRHGEHTSQVNGMVISTVPPVKSVGAVTMETKPGMTEKEKNDLEEELQMIKLRLQKTERELQEEKKLTQSQRDKLTTENHNMDELRAMFDQWKAGEKAEQQREIAELKRTFVQDMNSMREERDMFSDRVTALQEQLNSQKKTSMIGSIIDEDETDSPAKANRSEMSQQFMAQLEDKVIQMQTETQQNLQKEMQKMHQKFKAREDKSKKEHREEMGQFQEMMGQYEENLQNERIEKKRMSEDYESKIGGLQRQVQELRNALDAQKVETEKVQYSFKTQPPPLLASTPPVPAPRHIEKPVQAEPPERERATSPDKSIKTGAESITLYVATNQKKSGQYRLWRQTADGSNEWSNKYALSAFIKPTGNFTYPVYVFAAGGSPHWRQYVSDKSSPPSPEYRLDYMFYCSQTFLPGTLQYHVLEAGSIPVIRSYVSRTNSVPGWRHNGLSFYAPKSTLVSDKTLTSISASFESTLTEDKEQDFEPSESESEEESPVPVVPKVEVEDVDANDSTGSYDDVREITSGLSSSEWGTTTLETGEFHPIPHNRLITTRFNHKFDEVQAGRQEIAQILDQKLSKQGLSSENPRLSSQKMEAKMAALRTERQARSKKIKNFAAVRQRCVEELEEIVKKTYRSGTSTGKPGSSVPAGPGPDYRSHKDKPPTFKSTATAVRTSTSLQQGRKSPASRGTLVSTGSTSGGDMTVSVTSVTDGSFSGTSVVTERTLSESEEEVSVTEGSQEEEEEDQEEDEEESNWDSEEEAVKPPTQPTHKVAVHIPSQQDEESDSDIEELAPVKTIPRAAPRGEKVRELTETLERSLNFGSAVKKPAGGVSLHFQGNGNDNSEPPRATAQQSSGRKNDDDFDSDLSISSLEEKTPGRGTFDSGRRNLQPPGGSQSTGRQSPVLEFRRPQPQSTRIQAFTHDDFSDIEDD
ncbi:zinc finger protein DZIP1L-like [Pocillopora damicornis]|uniref:zinc finger protein DZIP1L-like n=1 Tax=Pocillopora damicornis TaxID=46731 RepID=UPI000F557B2A|nr:zinc finger protein DZIP1L-like [Pocillopora damicornis]